MKNKSISVCSGLFNQLENVLKAKINPFTTNFNLESLTVYSDYFDLPADLIEDMHLNSISNIEIKEYIKDFYYILGFDFDAISLGIISYSSNSDYIKVLYSVSKSKDNTFIRRFNMMNKRIKAKFNGTFVPN